MQPGVWWMCTGFWYWNIPNEIIWNTSEVCFVWKFSETFLLTLQINALVIAECLVCYCEWGSPSVQVTAVSWMLSVSAQALHTALYRSIYSVINWSSLGTLQGFLGTFTKFRKATISFVVSDRLFPRLEKFGFHCLNFHEILHKSIFPKSVQKIQV
jgi:hypothetical protein